MTLRALVPAVCGLLVAAGCQKNATPTAPDRVQVDKWMDYIKTETVAASAAPLLLDATGRVAFDEDHTQHVGAPVNGRVTAVRVRLGELVKVGQVLVELTSSDVAQLQSEVKKSLQDFELARKAAERTERLRADGAVSDKELAQAKAELEKARAEVERGDAQLRALGIRATDPVVRAAMYARVDGTVVDRNVLVGEEVRSDAGTPLLTITNLDTVWVLADVYEQDLGQVVMGAPVRVRVPAYPQETFTGQVAYVGDVVDPQTRTVKVRCVVPNPEHRLKPEMFAKVELEHKPDAKAFYVPTKALVRDGAKTMVIAMSGDKQFVSRPVVVGDETGGRQRVLDGLHEGDVIVTEGAIFLHNVGLD